MPRSKFSDENIVAILNEHNAGRTANELCRVHGMSPATFYNWKARYAVIDRLASRRLKGLEDENTKLRQLLADAILENARLKDQIFAKK